MYVHTTTQMSHLCQSKKKRKEENRKKGKITKDKER